MKKGCALTIVVWVALVGLYGYLAWSKVHEWLPVTVIAGLGGTFAAAFVGSVVGLFTGARDRAAFRRALANEAPQDGRLEVLSGPIRPSGAPLKAPFTGRPCVAYEYSVKAHDVEQAEFVGVALAPSAIDTSRGSARVLGWSILDQFPPASIDTADRERGTAYLKSAVFDRLGVTNLVSILGDLLADDDGAIRKDMCTPQTEVDLEGKDIEERSVPVGEVVTIIGKWSSAKQGVGPAGGVSLNRLYAGDAASTRKKLSGDSTRTFFMGLGFFVALHAILVPMFVFGRFPDEQAASTPSVWDEPDCDRLKTELAAGADPNEHGRDGLTPLMNVAREGEPACVSTLIAAGARLEDEDSRGDTAFTQAVMAGRDENVELLRRAGAKDFRITAGAGRAVVATDEPVIAAKDYIAAVHRADFQTMARLVQGASVAQMEARREDLPLWQSIRPLDGELLEGWMTDSVATITLHSKRPTGDWRVSYHLERQADGWRIRREWFPDGR